MTRHESRELAFLLLFQKEFALDTTSLEEIITVSKEARQTKVSDYAKKLTEGVIEKKEQLDNIISNLSVNWSINRISKTSLCLLRLGLYEILYEEDLENGIIVNEIVELAKEYGGDEDDTFVNGLLRTYLRQGDE